MADQALHRPEAGDPADWSQADWSAAARDRVQGLMGELSQDRRSRLAPTLRSLLDGPQSPSPQSPGPDSPGDPLWPEARLWKVLAEGLSEAFLSDFQVAIPHLQEMLLRGKADKGLLQTFGPIYQALQARPLQSTRSLSEALRLCGLQPAAKQLAGPVLYQLFVTALHRRLQLLYQVFLATQPFAPRATQDARMQHLRPLEAAARQLVVRSDPAGLLRWLEEDDSDPGLDRFLMALNKYAFEPYRINFRFTHHCNIQCAHCYNFSGPHMKSERIDSAEMLRIVADMPRTGMADMNLTGGEPFMYMDTVLALVRAAREAGVPAISMYTNGFFAKTADNCRRVLLSLKDAGFMNDLGRDQDHIKVSAGVYHQEFLAFDVIITLIRVYHEVFGKKIIVDYEALDNWREVQNEIRDKLRAAGVGALVDIHFRQITPVGRGAQFDPQLEHQPLSSFPSCGFIDEIVFDPDGSVRPCCGMNFDNHGIAVGTIDGDGLKTLLMRTENNPILQFIARHPIGDIFAYLDKPPTKTGYANICNVCHDAVGGLKENEALKRKLAPLQEHFPFWWEAAVLGAGAV